MRPVLRTQPLDPLRGDEGIRDAGVCKALAELLPPWIERESTAIAELEGEAERLAARYE